jgi:hypothetical protein
VIAVFVPKLEVNLALQFLDRAFKLLCILDVKKKAPTRRDKEPLGGADEILVTRAFLEDKQTALQALCLRSVFA